MALYVVMRETPKKQFVLLATTNRGYAKTKYELETTKLRDGSLVFAKIKRIEVLERSIGRSVR